MSDQKFPTRAIAVVNRQGRRRIEDGLPWIFRADVLRGPEADATSAGPAVVQVRDERDQVIGHATWALRSPIALRVLQRSSGVDETVDFRVLLRTRLQRALAWRRESGVAGARSAFRMVHGEGDDLPGLFVDHYGDTTGERILVAQTAAVAMEAELEFIARELCGLVGAQRVVIRNDGSTRDFEHLPRQIRVWTPDGPADPLTVVVRYAAGGLTFETDLLSDSKTGAFLDQAENHAFVAGLAPPGARVLDAFAHHGGFGLALAGRGAAVLANDLDPAAAARIQRNVELNRLTNVEVRRSDAFTLLAELEAQRRSFEVVVIDPPALAKRGGSAQRERRTGRAAGAREGALRAAERGYGELLLRGLRLTAPGGLLVACSCSGQVTRTHWDEIIAGAAARAGRWVQILARRGAGLDHPERLGVPESGHLKCWVMRVG